MAQTAFATMALASLVAGAAGFICFKKVSLANNKISFQLKNAKNQKFFNRYTQKISGIPTHQKNAFVNPYFLSIC